jgi:FkbM family methyltransferase
LPIRSQILAAGRAIGVEPQLRRLQRALENRSERQNRSDDEHLAIVLASILRANSNCIDVGANVGAVTDRICDLAPGGHHIAVEPLPELAARLEQRRPEVEVHCCALSDVSGTRTFVREVNAPARSGFRRQNGGGSPTVEFPVEVRRLDDIVPADTSIDFIKIDVEGAEGEVLRGALETIVRCRPVIALEHGASAVRNYGTPHHEIHGLLSEAGLAIFDMDGNGPFSRAEFDLVSDPPGSRWNFLARPV